MAMDSLWIKIEENKKDLSESASMLKSIVEVMIMKVACLSQNARFALYHSSF